MNIEQLIALADYLDENGAHEEANKLDELISHAGGEGGRYGEPDPDPPQPGEMGWPEEHGPDTPEYNEKLRQQMGRDEDKATAQALDSIEDKMIALRTDLHSLRSYLPEELGLGELGETLERALLSVDEYLAKKEAKSPILFSKLAEIADRLDTLSAHKEADLVDQFISKHAAEGILPGSEEDLGKINNAYKSIQKALGDIEQGLVDLSSSSMGDSPKRQEQREALHKLKVLFGWKELSDTDKTNKQSNTQLDLSKHAEDEASTLEASKDDVVDWKPEADTEQSKRYDAKHHHSLQVREPKTDKERVDREGYKDENNVHTMQPMKEAMEKEAASTRYCPEHIGVTMGRVGEATYQCPLDGKTYNWEVGFTDYDGKHHEGGSVAAQTPDSTGYEIPHRIFDSRENILNRVN